MERDPLEEETVIEIETRRMERPGLGEVIVLEEQASRRGVTESQLLKEIREAGVQYRDLGGVLVAHKKLGELMEALGGAGTLGAARSVLREYGVTSFMPVLEALGFEVEWRSPRDQSRVYKP